MSQFLRGQRAWIACVVLGGMSLAGPGNGISGPVNYGQAISKQKRGDWEGAIQAYQAVIQDLLATQPQSMLLPKSYVGCAYSSLKLGDADLAYQCLLDLWQTGAWANPNLPASPEFEGYRMLLAQRYTEAIDAFVEVTEGSQPGTKKWQEGMIALATCHLMIGSRGHGILARRILNEVATEVGDKEITAFAEWMTGVSFLANLDVGQAMEKFALAQSIAPAFDPSETVQTILIDQLQPPADVQNGLGDSGDELAQLLEDYVNAWTLTLKGRELETQGDSAGAQGMYEQAAALWSQSNVSSTGFLGY